MSYQEKLYRSALDHIKLIYEESKYKPEVDLYRSIDIIDSLSNNQIWNKEWLVNELVPHVNEKCRHIIILGSWYGLLSAMLREKLSSNIKISNVDSDWMSAKIGESLLKDYDNINFIVDDAMNYFIEKADQYQIIINTSCEHMERDDVKLIVEMKRPRTLICFQSNNYHSVNSHINTSNSLEEFVDYLNLKEIYYKETKSFDDYDRYMVIGR